MHLSYRDKSTTWLSLCLVGLVISACEDSPTEGSIFGSPCDARTSPTAYPGERFCDNPTATEVAPTHDTLTAGRVDTVTVRVRWPSGTWYDDVGASWRIQDTTIVTVTGCRAFTVNDPPPCSSDKSRAFGPWVEITALKAGETWLVVHVVGPSRLLSDSALVVVTPAM